MCLVALRRAVFKPPSTMAGQYVVCQRQAADDHVMSRVSAWLDLGKWLAHDADVTTGLADDVPGATGSFQAFCFAGDFRPFMSRIEHFAGVFRAIRSAVARLAATGPAS